MIMSEDNMHIEVLGSDVLRQKAEPISEINDELLDFADHMLETMYEAPGVGLAAPQVGRSIRLIVVDVAFREEDEYGERKRDPKIMFNPIITPVEGCGLVEDEEGCLSVPDVFANVSRPEAINLEYQNEDGEIISLTNVDGFLARVVQHEVDHLNGVLFVDKISPAERALNASKLKKIARGRS
jgi:peptide deformylase